MGSKQRRQVSRNLENLEMRESVFSSLQAKNNFPDALRPPKWFQLKQEVSYLRLQSKTLEGYVRDIEQTIEELTQEYRRPELYKFAERFRELSELVLMVETPKAYRKAGATLKLAMEKVESDFYAWIKETPEIEATWNTVRQGYSPLND